MSHRKDEGARQLRERVGAKDARSELGEWEANQRDQRRTALSELAYKQYMEDLLLLTTSAKMLLRNLLSDEFGADQQEIEDYRRGAHQIRAVLVKHGYSFSQVLKLVAALLMEIGHEPSELHHVTLLQELFPTSYRQPPKAEQPEDEIISYIHQRTSAPHLNLVVAIEENSQALEFDFDPQDDALEVLEDRFGEPGETPEQLIWWQKRDEVRRGEAEGFYENSSLLTELGIGEDTCIHEFFGSPGFCIHCFGENDED
jgi:hypothetical protein